ncbi:MAG: hypothetical protein LBD24_05030 [Spirochaetaceae bacterium]|jgi:hypothetical protein|nr:hypothetical protein [Spirochaetaceae bacterium]
MIYTAGFLNVRKVPNPIAISASMPDTVHIPVYELLTPSEKLGNSRLKLSVAEYARIYHKEVLSNLTIEIVSTGICRILGLRSFDNLTLVSWDRDLRVKEAVFSHRHLVSKWLRDKGLDCIEWFGRAC